jgi:hypothetical protein
MSLPQADGIHTIVDRISIEAEKDGALVSIESTIQKEHQRRYLKYSIIDYMLFMLVTDGMH